MDTKTQEIATEPKLWAIAPFLWVGLLWAVIGTGISLRAVDPTHLQLRWLLSLWFLCMVDILALAKTILSSFLLLSPANSDIKAALKIQTGFWGSLKLGCLGCLGFILFQAKTIPAMSLFLGLSTMIIVPLLGGVWWSFQQSMAKRGARVGGGDLKYA